MSSDQLRQPSWWLGLLLAILVISLPAFATSAPKISPSKALAVITMADGGVIKFKFYPKDAPKTVKNFIDLANKGFFNGLKFHRVVPGFVIQGGCPKGNGTGDAGYKIKAEFNAKKHLLGTVAMARAQHPDSAGSQFYICLSALPQLDGQYTVFGQVVDGMDVVQRVKADDVMTTVVIEKKASGNK